MPYDQELLDVANFLREAGITNDQVTRLHHFSLRGGTETINSTIGYIQSKIWEAKFVGRHNDCYYQRLTFHSK